MQLLKKVLTHGLTILGLSLTLSLPACADDFEVQQADRIKQNDLKIAAILSEMEDKDDGFENTKSLAMKGVVAAQRELGMAYNYGYDGAPIDLNEATKWLEKASESGDAEAQYQLALLYDSGAGVYNNPNEAMKWYLRSANQGYVDAQFRLSQVYLFSNLVPQNPTKTFEWATKAALQEHGRAQRMLGIYYDKGIGVRQNKDIAKAWFAKACSNDDEYGCDGYRELNEKGH